MHAIVRMVRMRAPVVMAVQGNVAGGSVSLMAAGDLVVIGKSARISSAFAKIGFTPDSGSTTTVTRRIGVARARRFFLLAETMDADTALASGLVDFVVSDDAVLAEAEKIARELASGPTEAYGGIKRLFLQTPNRSLESQLEDEAQTLAAISRTADAQEGVKAFREKRKPTFAENSLGWTRDATHHHRRNPRAGHAIRGGCGAFPVGRKSFCDIRYASELY